MSDYLTTQAMRAAPREVALRSTWNGRRLLIDTGDANWRVIEVDADGWRYREHSPVPFRRSDVTGAMPQPAANGSLDDLWALVNVTEDDRPLVLALLICSWMTGISQPIVFVTGPQDAGKTEFARFALSIVDPVTIPERGGALPTKEEDWKSRVSAYRCVLIDNASHITAQQSDTLCKVTQAAKPPRGPSTPTTPHISQTSRCRSG